MKKAVKKTKATTVASTAGPTLRVNTVLIELEEAERLVGSSTNVDKWVLLPIPEPKFAGPANRKMFLDAVAHARVQLVHDKFGTLYDDARELSDAGGVLRVDIYHVRGGTRVTTNCAFIDGKMHKDSK